MTPPSYHFQLRKSHPHSRDLPSHAPALYTIFSSPRILLLYILYQLSPAHVHRFRALGFVGMPLHSFFSLQSTCSSWASPRRSTSPSFYIPTLAPPKEWLLMTSVHSPRCAVGCYHPIFMQTLPALGVSTPYLGYIRF